MSHSITDRRLLPLVEAIEGKQFDVLSIDVFDTLLWRRVPEPKDIFCLVGAALLDNKLLVDWTSSAAFADLRASAEKAARALRESQTGSREVLLTDIYDQMPVHVWKNGTVASKAVDTEIDIEASSMMLDPDVAALMDQARDAGVGVILTSDTYFTRAQLIRFLTSAGLEEQRIPDTLYVSNEHGRPKWRDLFDLVVQDQGVAPERMVHLGDNVDADIVPCAARGIAHLHYDKWSSLPRSQAYEIQRQPGNRAAWLVAGGEWGLAGLRSRLAHRAPEELGSELEPYWTYGATTLAPLFAAYGSWVLRTLGQEGLAESFGIMREGRFLNRVVSTVASQTDQEVETTDLWLSRRAVVRAALWDDDFSLLANAISYCPGPSTDDILRQLGLTRSDLADTFKDVSAVDLHAPGGVDALLIAVSRSPEMQSKIAAESARLRSNLLTYMSKTVDFENHKTLCLLDLGYAGTIQTALQEILERERSGVSLTGLYVAINGRGQENVRAGTDLRALISQDGYASRLVGVLERTPDVLEHACMCVEGSLDQFDDQGQPELLPSQRDPKQIAQMEAMQDGIVDGVKMILTRLGQEAVASPAFVQHAAGIVYQAMIRPTRDEAETIGGWLHEANFDLSDKRTLADLRMDGTALEFGRAEDLLNIQRHEAYWPAAALMRVAPHLCETAAALLDETVTDAAFTSGSALGALVVVPDLGIGFDEKRQSVIPLTLSPVGRGTLEKQIKPFGPDAYSSLRLAWPRANGVVSIESCILTFRGESQSSQIDVSSQLAFSGGAQAGDGFVKTGPDGAHCEISLASVTPPWPHAIDLHMKVVYARLDRLF